MKLVGYLRISTSEKSEPGQGLDLQRASIRRWVRGSDHRVVAWASDEGVSGAKPAEDRPGLAEALSRLRDGEAAGLIVRDLDRLARSVTVQEAALATIWTRLGGSLFTVSQGEILRDDPDDPMRTAMREMAGVFSGLERRLVVKRMRDGRLAKAARGEHSTGCYPYGQSKKGVDAEAQLALARMIALRQRGLSTRAIAAQLAEEGFPTQRGGRWTSPVVSRILARVAVGGGGAVGAGTPGSHRPHTGLTP